MLEEKKQENIKDDFTDKLIAEIREKKIEPKPRWRFLLKNYTLYAAGALSLLIGSLAVAVMIYLARFNDLSIHAQIEKTFLEFLLLNLPYFWLLFLAFFIFIIYYNLRHTSKGYRYSPFLLVAVSVVLSIILGVIFFFAGFGEKIDDVLGRKAPFYGHFINRQVDFWSQPDEGRLAGIIISSDEKGAFILLDRDLKEWKIVFSSKVVYNPNLLINHQPIRLFGYLLGKDEFIADRIFFSGRPGQEFFRELERRPRRNRIDGFMEILPPPSSVPFSMPRY